jgi:hypothetical protein
MDHAPRFLIGAELGQIVIPIRSFFATICSVCRTPSKVRNERKYQHFLTLWWLEVLKRWLSLTQFNLYGKIFAKLLPQEAAPARPQSCLGRMPPATKHCLCCGPILSRPGLALSPSA